MPKKTVDLAARIAKIRPLPEHQEVLVFENHRATGLPYGLPPFWMCEQYDEGHQRTGLFQVCTASRKNKNTVVLADLPGPFAAYRAMIDCYEAWLPMRTVERVYFIGTQLKVGKLLKVGVSRDPQSRLRALQTAQGERLQIFATIPGDKFLEAKYHQRWHARRRSGEWFTIGDCIIKEVERVRKEAA